jgi:DNA anti-recombination protein RmuC
MEHTLNEIYEKIKTIKEEVDKVEYRVMSTKSHLDTLEQNLERINKEVLEGFHKVCSKINHLEEEIKKVATVLEKIK